jgi:hypothetical protein
MLATEDALYDRHGAVAISAQLRHAFFGTHAAFLHEGSRYNGRCLAPDGTVVRAIRPKWPHPMYPIGHCRTKD